MNEEEQFEIEKVRQLNQAERILQESKRGASKDRSLSQRPINNVSDN